jgi:hypothetical protein
MVSNVTLHSVTCSSILVFSSKKKFVKKASDGKFSIFDKPAIEIDTYYTKNKEIKDYKSANNN